MSEVNSCCIACAEIVTLNREFVCKQCVMRIAFPNLQIATLAQGYVVLCNGLKMPGEQVVALLEEHEELQRLKPMDYTLADETFWEALG